MEGPLRDCVKRIGEGFSGEAVRRPCFSLTSSPGG